VQLALTMAAMGHVSCGRAEDGSSAIEGIGRLEMVPSIPRCSEAPRPAPPVPRAPVCSHGK
jgi:hypothetical protein